MKLKVCVILAFSLATSQVAAQSLLKNLGKSIEKTVERAIEKTVEKEVGVLFDNQNGNASSFSSQQQNTPTEQPQVSTAPTQRVSGIRTAVLSDSGENIPREPGLDYIDEYGINHGGGEGLVWHLFFSTDYNRVEVNPVAYPYEGFAVRCVKEIEGQRRR